MRNKSVFLFAAALPALAFGLSADANAREGYREFREVERDLRTIDRGSRNVSVESIGRSPGGRAIHVATIFAEGEVDPMERPAVFVGANIVGYHNAGTEAALELIERLAEGGDEIDDLLSSTVFYVAPALNPDAHDAMFERPRFLRSGHEAPLDRDRDGYENEDAPDDLNADGLITIVRIPDPAGTHIADPVEPRLMIRPDRKKGERGEFVLRREGFDNDDDGRIDEDGPGGLEPNKNFAHAFPYPAREAGPWPSAAPETKAIMDFLLARRHVSTAVVFGPANNFLSAPRGLGGRGFDPGSQRLEVPERVADFLGLDADRRYTLDEIWEVAKDNPVVQQNNITKMQILQFIGSGPATQPDDQDLALISHFADRYKERLDEAGLDAKRSGAQYGRGGFTPWLYYQAGLFAVELDVWGVPKREEEKKDDAEEGEEDALTVERLGEMSSEEFLELGEEKVAAFLESIGAPEQFSAEALIARVEQGQVTPEQMARMAERMADAREDEPEEGEPRADDDALDLLAWVEANDPDAFVEWTPVTLPDGEEAEVGGFDPFARIAPPREHLDESIDAHVETVFDLARSLPSVRIIDLEVEPMGGGVHRVKAAAVNDSMTPTHTQLAVRAQTHLPVRFEMVRQDGVEMVTGGWWTTQQSLGDGVFRAEWIVRAAPGARTEIFVTTENAGEDRRTIRFGEAQ